MSKSNTISEKISILKKKLGGEELSLLLAIDSEIESFMSTATIAYADAYEETIKLQKKLSTHKTKSDIIINFLFNKLTESEDY